MTQSRAQDTRSFRMSVNNGWTLQCANTTCLPYAIVNVPNVRKCQTTCLTDVLCKAASYRLSTSTCDLFTNTTNGDGNVMSDPNSVTMIVVGGSRIPAG